MRLAGGAGVPDPRMTKTCSGHRKIVMHVDHDQRFACSATIRFSCAPVDVATQAATPGQNDSPASACGRGMAPCAQKCTRCCGIHYDDVHPAVGTSTWLIITQNGQEPLLKCKLTDNGGTASKLLWCSGQ